MFKIDVSDSYTDIKAGTHWTQYFVITTYLLSNGFLGGLFLSDMI
jgi:hypothetical protein